MRNKKTWEEMGKKEKSTILNAIGSLYGNEIPLNGPAITYRPRKKKTYTEHTVQCTIVSWCRLNGLDVHSIPNGGKRGLITGMRERSAGLTAGVSDLFIPEPHFLYHGIYMEIKSPGKYPTDLQYEWLVKQSKKGYLCVWSDNSDDAIKLLEFYKKTRWGAHC